MWVCLCLTTLFSINTLFDGSAGKKVSVQSKLNSSYLTMHSLINLDNDNIIMAQPKDLTKNEKKKYLEY